MVSLITSEDVHRHTSHLKKDQKVAFIDCGSGSQKLIIIEKSGEKRLVENIKITYNLEALFDPDKEIKFSQFDGPKKKVWDCFIADLNHLIHLAGVAEVSSLHILCTAAVRDAHESVQSALKKGIKKSKGSQCFVHILTGVDEAILCAVGSLYDEKLGSAPWLYVNQGGRSMELVEGKGGKILKAESLVLGRNVLARCRDTETAYKKSQNVLSQSGIMRELDEKAQYRCFLGGGVAREMSEIHFVKGKPTIGKPILSYSVKEFKAAVGRVIDVDPKVLDGLKLRSNVAFGLVPLRAFIEVVNKAADVGAIQPVDFGVVRGFGLYQNGTSGQPVELPQEICKNIPYPLPLKGLHQHLLGCRR